ALRLLQDEARAQGVALLPSVAAAATRYLSHARGDHKRALKLMEETQEWRLSYFQRPLTGASLAEDLKLGIVYFTGFDKALRPVLVFRASRLPSAWHRERRYDKVIRVLLFCLEYFLRYMVVPGKIESLNVLVDLQ
ncbi:unnamed protein product, partial [Polarella glacialis]